MAEFKELFYSVKQKDYENDARLLGLSTLIENEVARKLQSRYRGTKIRRNGIEYDLVRIYADAYIFGHEPEEFGINVYAVYVVTNPDEKDQEIANEYRHWFSERLPYQNTNIHFQEMYEFSIDDYLNDDIEILINPNDENNE